MMIIAPSPHPITPMPLVERALHQLLGHGYAVRQETAYDQSYASPAPPQKIEYLIICRWNSFLAYVFRGYSDPNMFYFVANHSCYGSYYARTYAWDLLRDGVKEIPSIRYWLEHDYYD